MTFRELITTPVERPLTAVQERNQWLLSQEPNLTTTGEPKELTSEGHLTQPETPPEPFLSIQPDTSTLDLQTLLLALTRQVNNQPKKAPKGSRNPTLLAEGT